MSIFTQFLIVVLLVIIASILINIDSNLAELGRTLERIKGFLQRRDK